MLIRLICFFCMTLVSINITFAQLEFDGFGKPFNPEIVRNSVLPFINDTTFILVDTLEIPMGYEPHPGQLSKDGLEYYVSLFRGSGIDSLYVLKRSHIGEKFGQPQLLDGAINDPSMLNYLPSITADKKTIVFVRSSHNLWVENDLYIATRFDTLSSFDSVRALAEINIPDVADAYPWISSDGLKLYFTKGSFGLHVASRNTTNDLFGTPQLINLNFSEDLLSGWLSNDELQLYFTGGGTTGLFNAFRSNPTDTFSTPVRLPEFSGSGFISGVSLVENELYLFNSPQSGDNRILIFSKDSLAVGIDETWEIVEHNPKDFMLYQNFPNPFNPSTTIKYSITEGGIVTIEVYDILSRMVKSLVNKFQSLGEYTITFSGEGLPSGIYLYKMSMNNFSKTKKFIFIK